MTISKPLAQSGVSETESRKNYYINFFFWVVELKLTNTLHLVDLKLYQL